MTYADVILAALGRSGRSGRDVSLAAVGHESAIRSIKRGMDVRASTLQRLCEELGLEFYVGPPRSGAGSGGYDTEIRERERPPAWVVELRDDLRGEIRRLAGGERAPLGAEPARMAGAPLAADLVWSREPRETAGVRFIDCYDVPAAAAGRVRLDDSTRSGCLAFRRNWLELHHLDAARCAVVHVHGDSMEPTLNDGSTILVNRAQRRRRSGCLFMVRTSEGLLVNRVVKDAAGRWQLVADTREAAPRPWPDDAEVLGQVRWGTRTWS